jgi:sulfite reductase (NADPH) flavoprotein alpha-component
MSAQPAQTFPLSPLDEERAQLLARVVDGLDASSLQWISGFTAGIAFERAAPPARCCRSRRASRQRSRPLRRLSLPRG